MAHRMSILESKRGPKDSRPEPRRPAVPVVLFAYARPAHLRRVLDCLRENRVPRILAFADGAKGARDARAVDDTRTVLRAIDWAEVTLVERERNLGLGRNVISGVSEVAAREEAFIVWEDDLVCVPGTYDWLCAALAAYAHEARVMSVTAWTHPRVTPPGIGSAPYLDGRAECWVWAAWSRSWRGMESETALQKAAGAKLRGIAADAYGADLPGMARDEARRNIWAVRWLYHHFQNGGLCVRPPWSMVDHIGTDAGATNAIGPGDWAGVTLRPAPPIPTEWPEPREDPACRPLWRASNPAVSLAARIARRIRRILRVQR